MCMEKILTVHCNTFYIASIYSAWHIVLARLLVIGCEYIRELLGVPSLVFIV